MIGRFYRWLFDLHRHEWETIATAKINKDGKHVGNQFTLRCKVCGEIVTRTFTIWD